MKSLLKQYKPVIKFIATFLLVYGVLSLAYSYYLDASKGTIYYPDYVTNLVANQSEILLDSFGYDSQVLPHPNEPSMKLLVNGKYIARVIEGCNGTSVIILFIAFVVAFAGRAKTTFFYILSGSVVKFSVIVYGISYVILIALFLYFVLNPKQEDYYVFFNIRRFLIQPLILLLLLPAYYYQRLKV